MKDTPPKKGFWTPLRLVRFPNPPPARVIALLCSYKNPRLSRSEARLKGFSNLSGRYVLWVFPPPIRFAPPPYHGPNFRAPVRFGYGLGVEQLERFRFSVLAVPLRKGGSCVSVQFSRKGRFRFQFRFLEDNSGGYHSAFGSWKNGFDGSGFRFMGHPETWHDRVCTAIAGAPLVSGSDIQNTPLWRSSCVHHSSKDMTHITELWGRTVPTKSIIPHPFLFSELSFYYTATLLHQDFPSQIDFIT